MADNPVTITPSPAIGQVKPSTPITPVSGVKPPVTAPIMTKTVSASDKESSELHTKIQEIVREHDGIESNIPHNHEYWSLLNRFRTLVNRK